MIDIVIPVWNAFFYLERCINSILKYDTTLLNRIILADDCSDEGKLEDLFTDKRILVVRDGRRKYFSENTNFGISFVETEYFITMNSDCMITKFSPDWMNEFYRNRNKGYVILSAISCMEEHGHSPYVSGIENGCHGPNAWFIEKKFWDKMGGLRSDGKNIHWHSDIEFMEKVTKLGYKTGLLHIYIQHEGSKSVPVELLHTKHL